MVVAAGLRIQETTVVIGIDCHKATLSACAVDSLGAEVSAAAFRNTAAGHVELLSWPRALGGVSRIGIEGSGYYGRALARFLDSAGESVVEVPARLTQRERGRLQRPGKSDGGDALAIARVAAREKQLPPAGRDDVGQELRQLLDYREQLVKERTRVANRVHADLMARHPGYQEAVKNLVSRRWLRAAEALIRADTTVAGALAGRRLGKRLSSDKEIAELSRLIADRVERRRSGLTGIPGVGVLVTGRILAEVGDVRRYRSAAHFAAANGTAPVPSSSGQVGAASAESWWQSPAQSGATRRPWLRLGGMGLPRYGGHPRYGVVAPGGCSPDGAGDAAATATPAGVHGHLQGGGGGALPKG